MSPLFQWLAMASTEPSPLIIHHSSKARDLPEKKQFAWLNLVDCVADQDTWLEMDFIANQLPAYVASVSGTYATGYRWMIIVQRGPSYPDSQLDLREGHRGLQHLQPHMTRVLGFNPGLRPAEQTSVTQDDIDHWIRGQITGLPLDASALGFTDRLRALIADACGYPVADLLQNVDSDCAYPNLVHACQGLYGDIFRSPEDRITFWE